MQTFLVINYANVIFDCFFGTKRKLPDAQANFNLRSVYMPDGTFTHDSNHTDFYGLNNF